MNNFAHLHVHTDASKDGLGRVEDLVKFAKEQGFDSLAMTDHGTMSNTIAFIHAAKKNNIKPIIGLEGYIEVDGKRGHITVLSDGDKGYKSLVDLHNAAHRKAETYKDMATFNVDELIKYNEGLIILSGCVASPLHQMSLSEALSLGQRLKNVYNDRMFAEIMHVGDSNDIWLRSLELADNLNIPLVATNDVHFQRKDHAVLHPILTKMKASYDYNSKELYLKSMQEMIDRGNKLGIRGFENAVYQAGIIAAKITTPTILKPQKLPSINNAYELLVEYCENGMKHFRFDVNPEYIERLKFELSVIKEINFANYFIILLDMINFAKSNDIRIGAGRGSGAGSLVNYLLGITSIDPILYNLSFERFLNPLRKGMPDVDTDFDPEGRELIFRYMEKKYGAVAIASYQSLTKKNLVHKLAKHFLYSREVEVAAADGGESSPEYKSLESTYPLFKKAIEVMEDQEFGMGQHAAGLVLAPDDMPLPIVKTNRGYNAAAFSEGSNTAEYLKEAGFVKFDVLGVSALTPLYNLEKRFNMVAPKPEYTSNEDKAAMLEALQLNKIQGIFQFTTPSAIQLLKSIIKDATIDDLFERLVIACTIIRPAVPVQLRNEFHKLLKSPRKLHPLIDDIIEKTGGVMIYQEQMMSVFAKIAGGGDADGDLARRAITKVKNPDGTAIDLADKKNTNYIDSLASIKPLKQKFFDGGTKQGIDNDLLEYIWTEILAGAGYGFNRSHSVSYMFLAWQQLWWFVKQPVGLYAEWCKVENDDDKVFAHLFNAASMGIKISPPSVNYSSDKYEYDEDTIYIPLSQIKGLDKGSTVIVNERETNGLFTSIEDFNTRVPSRSCNSGVKVRLWELGAFEGIEGSFEEFKIKDKEKKPDTTKSIQELQMESLKFVIPTENTIKRMKQLRLGWKGGIVTDIEIKDKHNGKGEYGVIKFVPNDDLCVCRPIPKDVKPGDILFFKDIGLGIKKEFRKFNAN